VHKADNLPPSCAVVTKSGNRNFLESSGPLRACNGTDLPFTVLSFLFSLSIFRPFLFPFAFYFCVRFLVQCLSSVFLHVFLSPSFTFASIISWLTSSPSPLFLFILPNLPSHLLTFAYRQTCTLHHCQPWRRRFMICILNCACLLTLPAAWPVAFVIHLPECFLSLSFSMRYEKHTDYVISPIRWHHITHASRPARTVYFGPWF